MVLVHTPHLEDKLKGTRMIMRTIAAAIRNQSRLDPGRILIDHVEEHTVREVLDGGFWAGMTLYPDTKCTPQRAADIFEMHGTERIWINSAGDWGPSDPLAVPKCREEMRRRGHLAETIRKVSFENPQTFLSQSGRFRTDVAPTR
jgi:predicted metal-dependent TIM-barrel fold hydrolase